MKKSKIGIMIGSILLMMLCVIIFYIKNECTTIEKSARLKAVQEDKQVEGQVNNQDTSVDSVMSGSPQIKESYKCKNEYLYQLIAAKNALIQFKTAYEYYRAEMAENQGIETDSDQVITDLTDFMDQDDEDGAISLLKGEEDTSERVYLPEDASFNLANVSANSALLLVSYLAQNPELPTGCEITSLTTVLNYLGYDISKEAMAAQYLPKCSVWEGSFWDYFVGEPTSENSFGCYASPIVSAANLFFADYDSQYQAYNYSGSDFSVLLNEVANGKPVILWSTMGLAPAYLTRKWEVAGEIVQWIAPEHCVVMIGYDLDRGTVTISDPLCGIVERDLSKVVIRYHQMQSQAVVIHRVENTSADSEDSEATVPQESAEELTEGTTEGTTDGTTVGTAEGTTEGTTDGTTEGTIEGTTEGATDGTVEESTAGTAEESTAQ